MSDTNTERNKRNFWRFQEQVVVGGDMSLVPELMAPEFRVSRAATDSFARLSGREVPEERVWTPEIFARMYKEAVGKPSVHRRKLEEICGEGDLVCARWTIESEHIHDHYGVPPTGKVVHGVEVGFIRYDEDGRMVEGWFMSDPFEALSQLGATVTPAPEAVS